MLVLITIQQLWYKYPDVIALHPDPDAVIIDQECPIPCSSIVDKLTTPKVILKISQNRLLPMHGQVCSYGN